jgi:putative hydrolase of the HAD superfamily
MPTLLIIDLGGVLFDIDFERTRRSMMALQGYNGLPITFGVEQQDGLFVAYDRGDLSTAEFRTELRSMFGFTCDDAAIDQAWCAILEKGLYANAADEVRRLRTQHAAQEGSTAVILSNISELHYLDCLERCRPVFELVDNVYLSYVMRKRKPDAEAFLHVMDEEGFEPSSTVLVDDSEANCAAAAALGIHVVHVKR